MAATTTDRNPEKYGKSIQETHAIASGASLYVGALVNFNADGELVDATDAASQTFAGMVLKVNDDDTALIEWNRVVELNLHASVVAKNTGVCVLDNQTVALAASTTNSVECGRFVNFKNGSATVGFVHLTRI